MADFESYVGRLTQDQTIELTEYCLDQMTDENRLEVITDFLINHHDIRDEVVIHFEDCLDEEEE